MPARAARRGPDGTRFDESDLVRALLLPLVVAAALAATGCPRHDAGTAGIVDQRPGPWSPTVEPPHDETEPALLERHRLYP